MHTEPSYYSVTCSPLPRCRKPWTLLVLKQFVIYMEFFLFITTLFSVKNAVSIPEVALGKCEAHVSELTARVTRDLVFFLDRFRFLHIPIIDTLIAYALKKHEHLGPTVLVNVLVLCFNLGYSTKSLDILAPITTAALETLVHCFLSGRFVSLKNVNYLVK